MSRGDVVIVDFPFQDIPGSKVRPALVVQNDAENQRLGNTIVAMITGNLRDAGAPTNLRKAQVSGLHGPSLVKCVNLATLRQARVLQSVGHMSPSLMQRIDTCLKAALDLH